VTVNPVNDPPVAVDDAITTTQDMPVTANVLANDRDPDGDALTVSDYVTASAQSGTVSCAGDGVCTYTPPAGFNGTDSFTYTADDGHGGSDTGTVTVTVNPLDNPPLPAPTGARASEILPVRVPLVTRRFRV
jgi:hypothetical protein